MRVFIILILFPTFCYSQYNKRIVFTSIGKSITTNELTTNNNKYRPLIISTGVDILLNRKIFLQPTLDIYHYSLIKRIDSESEVSFNLGVGYIYRINRNSLLQPNISLGYDILTLDHNEYINGIDDIIFIQSLRYIYSFEEYNLYVDIRNRKTFEYNITNIQLLIGIIFTDFF